MATSRMRHDWNQTADTLAMIANVNRGKDSRAYARSDFHPMIKVRPRRAGIQLTPEVLRSRRAMFQ